MDDALIAEIRAAHVASKGTYGAPRLQIDLADIGIRVSRKRVARLMRHAGLAGLSRRKSTVTTVRDGARQAPDLVGRNFTADRPNMLWVADITYIPTWAGFLYLAVVLDAFSRRIVGWSMAITLHTRVVLDALNMALRQRRPSGVIHHSDHGSQYTSIEFGKRCREAGVRPSMGSVGDAYDNAMAESFFATLECELLGHTASISLLCEGSDAIGAKRTCRERRVRLDPTKMTPSRPRVCGATGRPVAEWLAYLLTDRR